jgi:phosphoglycerate dehydrogenase-like enzyme
VFDRSDRDAFLSDLDYLVLAMPLTSDTRRFIDATALAALPSHAVLVNISRGGLVDETALIAALSSGRLAGAVLDTFETEPLPRESPLWRLHNVTVTPHMAGAVYADELGPICARNLSLFASGKLPQPVVNLRTGY